MTSRWHTRFLVLALIIAALIAGPVLAAEISDIQYVSEVYTETGNYAIAKVSQPPEYVSAAKTAGGIGINTVPTLRFERYALVSKPGAGIDMSFILTSPGVSFTSDLDDVKVTINGVPIPSDTLVADKGLVRVKGNVPFGASMDQPVKLIHLAGQSDVENNKFLISVTTDERAAARNAIYLLNEKVTRGARDLQQDLQNAADSYKNGELIQAKIYADTGLQKSSIQAEGSTQGIVQAVLAAIVFLLIGIGIGYLFGRKAANKPDLLKVEDVVLKYYGMRSENPLSTVMIPKECEAAFLRAFDFNAKRADLLKKQLDNPVSRVDPDSLTSPDLRPSLFQALYEKTRYGRCNAFDAGISYLTKCMNDARQKR